MRLCNLIIAYYRLLFRTYLFIMNLSTSSLFDLDDEDSWKTTWNDKRMKLNT